MKLKLFLKIYINVPLLNPFHMTLLLFVCLCVDDACIPVIIFSVMSGCFPIFLAG